MSKLRCRSEALDGAPNQARIPGLRILLMQGIGFGFDRRRRFARLAELDQCQKRWPNRSDLGAAGVAARTAFDLFQGLVQIVDLDDASVAYRQGFKTTHSFP